MSAQIAIQASEWSEYGTAADNTAVVVTHAEGKAGTRNKITSLGLSYDTTASSTLELYGLSKVDIGDLTDITICLLSTEKFSVPLHGLADDEQVVFYTFGGTAPTGLTSGTTYFVIRTDANFIQLSSTAGGSAIALSGTQANFSTESAIIPLSKKMTVYDHVEIALSSPWVGPSRCPVILKAAAITSVQAKVDVSGYTL